MSPKPSDSPPLIIDLPDTAATDRFGAALADGLAGGDAILMQGVVGAGKSHLSRAIIRALTSPGQEVPSPTYTLVQEYETARGTMWHMDLYRLGSVEELAELGIDFEDDTVMHLIEWPERLGAERPRRCLEIALEIVGVGRRATLRPYGDGWDWTRKAVPND
ncbi:tRNA (adenosine(37)-N6)-threonylcarbamoyltransferase complex ATPase subunit type 1 TsaE [Roseobacter sp. HKCCA0434]|uniref:tRNA (adenosine(37)-N6)-threonylcarbamoyltransferase complex ATPase subunit type 1 TsaE n=1 Tax=Roseobacter sp. HKCCA0434 TaxID=3079297 RepID=UPI002905C953|nr:tRNA (adenosine(37)-N6)-threonylcarbamoyltransferase complex ATPase subunit type 1 TsaE [Roseobacter sp. HKCCA0434]